MDKAFDPLSMKSFLLFLIQVLLLLPTLHGQNQKPCQPVNRTGFITLDLVRDFCADPRGRMNAAPALAAAAKFITDRGGLCTLRIPAGQYRIATQDAALSGVVAFSLYRCKGVKIIGDGAERTRLFFAPGLRYGGFSADGKPYEGTDAAVKASPGNLIHLSECTDIDIADLELDGQSDALILGGHVSELGGKIIAYQLPNSGLALWTACRNIRIERLYVHHFALDGIMLNPYKGKPTAITLKNCRFEYNGRQGLSWSGGDSLLAEDCVFSHSGYGRIQDPPMAGVDIEPNGKAGTECTNGRFVRCRMINNRGYALLNPYSREVYSEQVRFESCLFHDNDAASVNNVPTAAVMVQGKKFTFEGCRIWGGFYYGHHAEREADATRFIRCDFADQPLNGKATPLPFLIYSDRHSNFMLFEQCTFRVSQPGKRFSFLINSNPDQPETFARFRNCRFTFEPGHRNGWNESAVFKACRFEGQTRFLNGCAGSGVKYLECAAIWMPGNSRAGKPDRTEIGTDILWNQVQTLSKGKNADLLQLGEASGQGRAELVFGKGSALQLKTGSLDIGPGGLLHMQAGSFFYAPGADCRVAGRLQMDRSVYFNLYHTRFNRTGNGHVHIEPEALPLLKNVQPFLLPPSAHAASPLGAEVIEGGHPALTR